MMDEDDDSVYEDTPGAEGSGFVATEPWKVGRPQPQPLTYKVPTAGGGSETRQIAFNVDFSDSKSVEQGNKRRRLGVWRRKVALGMAVMRPSTRGREYTQENNNVILAIHQEYAESNNNLQIPYSMLTNLYNDIFTTENRSESSISSHVARVAELKTERNTYRRR